MSDWILRIADGTEVDLPDGSLLLGRDDDCDVPFDEGFTGVSRQHARMETTSHGVIVTDLGSTNGTRVNGHRITAPNLVQPGDAFELGSVQAVLRARNPPGGATVTPRAATHCLETTVQGALDAPPLSRGEPARAYGGQEQRATGFMKELVDRVLPPQSSGEPSAEDSGASAQITIGSVLLIGGTLGWLRCSSALSELHSVPGIMIGLFRQVVKGDNSAQVMDSNLQTMSLIAAGVGMVGLILLALGLVRRYRRD